METAPGVSWFANKAGGTNHSLPCPLCRRRHRSSWSGAVDRTGVPLVNLRGGLVYNPLTTAHHALAHWDLLMDGRRESEPVFLRCAQWLEDNAVPEPANRFLTWLYTWPLRAPPVAPPWISGMAQGQALAVLGRAFQLTGSTRTADVARRAARGFLYAVADGGLITRDLEGNCFIEEVAASPAIHILNGCLAGLVGALEHNKLFPDAEIAAVLNACILGIEKLLPAFDTGYWSKYAVGRPFQLAPVHYHRVHIGYLRYLGTLFAPPDFLGLGCTMGGLRAICRRSCAPLCPRAAAVERLPCIEPIGMRLPHVSECQGLGRVMGKAPPPTAPIMHSLPPRWRAQPSRGVPVRCPASSAGICAVHLETSWEQDGEVEGGYVNRRVNGIRRCLPDFSFSTFSLANMMPRRASGELSRRKFLSVRRSTFQIVPVAFSTFVNRLAAKPLRTCGGWTTDGELEVRPFWALGERRTDGNTAHNTFDFRILFLPAKRPVAGLTKGTWIDLQRLTRCWQHSWLRSLARAPRSNSAITSSCRPAGVRAEAGASIAPGTWPPRWPDQRRFVPGTRSGCEAARTGFLREGASSAA